MYNICKRVGAIFSLRVGYSVELLAVQNLIVIFDCAPYNRRVCVQAKLF